MKVLSPDELSSLAGAYDDAYDILIDELQDTSEEFVNQVYDANLDIDSIDFSGGVTGITCRGILVKFGNDARQLNRAMGRKNHKENISECSAFLNECRQRYLDSSPYG